MEPRQLEVLLYPMMFVVQYRHRRWGHTFTALNHPRRNIQLPFDCTIIFPVAVLVGGRNTYGNCIDALYVLSIVPTYTSNIIDSSRSINNHFLWEKISSGNHSLYHNLSRCFHTATAIEDLNHIFVFGGLCHPEYLSESFDSSLSGDTDSGAGPSLLLTLTPYKSNAGSDTYESFRVDMDQVRIPNISRRFAHSAIQLTSSHEKEHFKLDLQREQSGIVLVAGGVSQKVSANTDISDREGTFMDCLHYVLTAGKIKFNGNLVDLCCNDVIDSKEEAMDPGPMIHHCCVSFPRNDPNKRSEFSQYDLLFIGGGVSGFAFQEFFAPSHHLSLQWSFRCMDGYGNDNNETKTMRLIKPVGRITPKSNHGKITESSLSDKICDQLPQCDVVYVLKQNAKVVKQYLEDSKFINKMYRMTAIEKNGISRWSQTEQIPHVMDDFIKDCVAIPIHAQFIGSVQLAMESGNSNMMSSIIGHGKQICLPSTGTYARGNGVRVL